MPQATKFIFPIISLCLSLLKKLKTRLISLTSPLKGGPTRIPVKADHAAQTKSLPPLKKNTMLH